MCDNEEDNQKIQSFIDTDNPVQNGVRNIQQKASLCANNSRIFHLVHKLVNKYHEEAMVDSLPVPADIITQASDKLPIVVRYVPLKACHGAVWHLSDCWLVHLNNADSSARQRFTLYHEIFHILAHSAAMTLFDPATYPRRGYFNEALADYFSSRMLLPISSLEKIWPQVKDIERIAQIFNVPYSIGSLVLTHSGFV